MTLMILVTLLGSVRGASVRNMEQMARFMNQR